MGVNNQKSYAGTRPECTQTPYEAKLQESAFRAACCPNEWETVVVAYAHNS